MTDASHDASPPPGGDHDPSDLLAELERQELAVHVDPRAIATPGWLWPALGIGGGAWVATYDLGLWVGTVGAGVFAAVALLLAQTTQRRRGLRQNTAQMPPSLRRPITAFGVGYAVVLLGGFLFAVTSDLPYRFTLLGAAYGVVLGGGGWLAHRWYLREAARIARAAGLNR